MGEAIECQPGQRGVEVFGLPVGNKFQEENANCFECLSRTLTVPEQPALELEALQRPLLVGFFCYTLPVTTVTCDVFAPRNQRLIRAREML